MKVLDLHCTHRHSFEGWFASEDDFQGQLARGLVECPLCGDRGVTKKLSAPRLNLGHSKNFSADKQDVMAPSLSPAKQALWMRMMRELMANTEDVGEQFAEEARKIHYGEAEERGIRGKASREETEALLEEGISVMPLPLPDAVKETLQ